MLMRVFSICVCLKAKMRIFFFAFLACTLKPHSWPGHANPNALLCVEGGCIVPQLQSRPTAPITLARTSLANAALHAVRWQ